MINLLIVVTRWRDEGLEGEFSFWQKYLFEAKEVLNDQYNLPSAAIFKADGNRQILVVRGSAFDKPSEIGNMINQLIQKHLGTTHQIVLTQHDLLDDKLGALTRKLDNLKCINSHSSKGKSNTDPTLSLARRKYLDIIEYSNSIAEMYSKFDDYWNSFFNQRRDEQLSVLKKVYAGQTNVALPPFASDKAKETYTSIRDISYNNEDASHRALFSNFRDALLDIGF